MSDLSLALPVHDTTPGGVTPASFQELCSDLETLIQMPDEEYSDLNIIVEGEYVPVHRCILAARCSGLRKVLAGIVRNGKSKLELELNTITDKGKIGYEAFRAVMGYVYGGKMEPWPVVIACYDSSCAHLTCRPAINHVLEILYAAILLNLPELNTLAQVCPPLIKQFHSCITCLPRCFQGSAVFSDFSLLHDVFYVGNYNSDRQSIRTGRTLNLMSRCMCLRKVNWYV